MSLKNAYQISKSDTLASAGYCLCYNCSVQWKPSACETMNIKCVYHIAIGPTKQRVPSMPLLIISYHNFIHTFHVLIWL